jgi:hypothetical protein
MDDPGLARRVLILGGGGMVGLQVAREIAKKLNPEQIIISALTRGEVDEAISTLRKEGAEQNWRAEFVPEAGDIFLPKALKGKSRRELITDSELFDALFEDIFSSDTRAWRTSGINVLLEQYRPDVVVDCINTATAISYQDVYTTSRRVKVFLDRIESRKALPETEIAPFVESIRELLIAQGVPQIVRHILYLHRALSQTDVRVYVKVGTTGTGGMGVNVPFTHSEDKPSATLLSKSAIGFAHTGLLFLLARTPGSVAQGTESQGTMIKEVKPGAMIGFKRLGRTHVRINGPGGGKEPGYLYGSRAVTLRDQVDPRESWEEYGRFEGKDAPIEMVGADTGENGFFSIGEFEAITYPRQMEYVTPEEVARTVVMEILGSATGRDVIAAIDGAITEPSYRAGLLRHHAKREMDRIEALLRGSDESILPSMAIGHLGPPRLSKLIFEAFLMREAIGSTVFADLLEVEPERMRTRIEEWLEKNPRITSLITTVGIPLLREQGDEVQITRGPRLNIPVPSPDGSPVPLDRAAIEKYAAQGWVDLRRSNFELWQERLRRLADAKPRISEYGSAAFELPNYIEDEFRPGDIVGWLLSNEPDESGMPGHRML